MQTCKRNLSHFQRRTLRQIGGLLGACVALSVATNGLSHSHFSPATYFGIAALAVVPIVGTMIVIARYLSRETDEYLRSVVVRAILWGFGLVMVADTFFGYITEFTPMHLPFGILNMDIFVIAAMISVRLQLRSNQ
jgi:hypothetical protein